MSALPEALAGLSTPAYVYELSELDASHARLRSFLPAPSALYYSLKANPHVRLVRRLRELGCRAEVSSTGELSAAVEAGFAAGEVLYSGPAKRDEDLGTALMCGVRHFSVDSPQGLQQLDAVAGRYRARARYLLRVNAEQPVPGVGLAMTGVPSQFGADAGWIEADPGRFVGYRHLDLDGLHLYMATNLDSEDRLVEQFAIGIDAADRLQRRLGVPLLRLDLGGGFGAPYARHGSLPGYPGLAGRLAALLTAAFPSWRAGVPEVVFESGRYLTATCGTLVTRVLDVKQSHGKRIVVVDSGINHLGGMSGLRRVPQIHPDLANPGATDGDVGEAGEAGEAMVTGPLCTPLDTWSRSGATPDFRAGDLAVIPNVGAYGLSASLALFLGHPMPTEVVTDGGQVVEATRLAVRRERTRLDSATAVLT